MAKLDEYWGQIQKSESFQDLDVAQKEKVRSRLWDQYVQKSPSYTNLALTQRNQVRKHFDDLTKIQEPTLGEKIVKTGEKVVAAAAPIAKKVGEAAANFVDPSKIGSDLEDMASTSVDIPGAKKLSGIVKTPFEKTADAVEPNFIKPELTQFDMARAVGSGAIRTLGDMISGLVPEGTMGAAAFFSEPIFKFAGTTFLGREISMPWSKAKTGLSSAANDVGSQFERTITQRRIENYARGGRPAPAGLLKAPDIALGGEGSTGLYQGPARPLEILANKESQIQAQSEVQQYEEWLQAMDKASPSGGEPTGDLHPQMKANVSQLRDMAKERLQKAQNEPVRVESLSKAEDELQGYYRRRVDQARVYMQGAGEPSPRQELLPEGPKPAGLLGAGEPPKPLPRGSPLPPAPPKPTSTPTTPTAGSPSLLRAKDVMMKMFKAHYPDQPKQVIDSMSGALLKSLDMKASDELSIDHLNLLESLMENEGMSKIVKENARPIAKDLNVPKLKEKGMDPGAVRAEAERLKAAHDLQNGSIQEARRQLKEVTGGIGNHDPDPMTGKVPEQEEVSRNVPRYLRGKTKPDQAAQMAFDAGLIPEPTVNSLFEYTKKLSDVSNPRSVNSFLDEAEYGLELQRQREAGFKPEAQTLPGMPQAEMPGSSIKPPEGSTAEGPLLDLTQRSAFDLTADLFKNLDEKGQIGGDIDPVRQARQEAIVKELVDRAMSLGYETSQDIMLYAARNAPAEFQDAIRKNLAPTLSAFDTHPYKEMEAARQGNPIAKKSMMDAAERNYFQKKADIVKGVYKKFKANQQVVVFKDMDEGLMRLQNDLFIHDNYRKFSKDELAAQRWYTEGKSPKLESLTALGVPEDTAKRWLNLAKNPTENMKKARPMTQVFEDEYYEVISSFFDHVGYREDHVTRRWKRPEQYLDWEAKARSNSANFTKGAKWTSQAEGINAGHEPVSFDIRDDLRASNNSRVNTLSRIHAYQKLGASFGPEGMPAIMDESGDLMTQAKNAKITPHQGEAPASWMRFEHVPLLKGLAIHPYYEPAMKFMMTRPFTGTTPEVLDFLSASTKATKLFGFFHGYTLGEMLFSGISYRDVFSFGKGRNVLWRGLKYAAKGMTADLEGETLEWGTPAKGIKSIGKLYDSFMTGSAMLANRPLALEMAEHGFKFSSADEDMHGILLTMLDRFEQSLSQKIGEGAAKGITVIPRKALEIQHKALWSYIRPVSSMLVYETNYADAALKNLELPVEKRLPIEQIKQAIVNQTSKEMGGISYARLMIDPRTQQVLQWSMLAPGWTIGRALMGASVLEKGPEGRQARKQMVKLFTAWFFASNMINYAQTKKYLGKGRFMWDNPEGYRNQAFIKKDAKGTEYMQLSKALTEIYDDLMHPARTAAYKLSAPVQAAAKVMNWATAKAYYPGVEPENPLMTAVHAYQPMITSGQSAYGGIPVRRGPSINKVEAMLDEYHRTGNQALFQEAMQTATEQGYDLSKLDQRVRGALRSKEKRALLE